ncbi:hypothetical protein SOVF_071170 [Spinacia oleracea]|nr:hypothetical protein SOVF_071170 [Spinacia oleracea]
MVAEEAYSKIPAQLTDKARLQCSGDCKCKKPEVEAVYQTLDYTRPVAVFASSPSRCSSPSPRSPFPSIVWI